jgi:hypothetical protein
MLTLVALLIGRETKDVSLDEADVAAEAGEPPA